MKTAALPTPDRILVDRGPGETRVALMAGDDLIEIVHRRDGTLQPGAVHFARTGAPVPGMPAVFASLGAVTGVLKLKPPFPTEGKGLAVSVVVPPRADKNAEVVLAPDIGVPADGKAGALLQAAPDPAVAWWARYGAGIAEVVCASRAEVARLKDLLGAGAPVSLHAGPDDLFAGVEEAVEAALEPVVMLPCGGSLIIEATAAAVVIDVNAGPADPETANRAALAAVARELRRRNLAGHVLVDTIPTRRRAALPRLLGDLTAGDPAGVRVAGLTPLGMVELTRRRVGLSLAETLCDASGHLSAETIALRALRGAVRFAFGAKAAHVALQAAPAVAAALADLKDAHAEAEEAIKGEIRIAVRADAPRDRVMFRPA